MNVVRVLLVSDHARDPGRLCAVLNGQEDMGVVGAVEDTRVALDAARPLHADVLILDAGTAGASGAERVRAVLAAHAGAWIIVLSESRDADDIAETFRAGARGYVRKSNAPAEIAHAIRAVAKGHTFISPEAAEALVSMFSSEPAAASARRQVRLSRREHEVLVLVVEGLRTKDIAARLGIGARTIDTHRAQLMKKLRCASTAELVRVAIREGIAPA